MPKWCHIMIQTLVNIGSGIGLLPWNTAIISIKTGLLLTGPLGENWSEIFKIQQVQFKNINFKNVICKVACILSGPQCVEQCVVQPQFDGPCPVLMELLHQWEGQMTPGCPGDWRNRLGFHTITVAVKLVHPEKCYSIIMHWGSDISKPDLQWMPNGLHVSHLIMEGLMMALTLEVFKC